MATLYGQVGEFVSEREEWTQYVERVEHFLAANDITDATRKRSIFLTVMGPREYKLLRSLVAPAKPGDKTFSELVAIMAQHHSPPPSEIVQRYRFHMRFRQPGVTVVTYVSELRALAQWCSFGESLDDMLRDRLVCGISDDSIQRRLLSESSLSFQKPLEIAQGHEAAARNAREIQCSGRLGAASGQTPPAEDVHWVHPGVCFRCGLDSHTHAQCPFKAARCHNCGKTGHIKRTCHSNKTDGSRPQGQ